MPETAPSILVLGASGLIGSAVAGELHIEGFTVAPVARRFNSAQKAIFGDAAIEISVVDLDVPALRRLLTEASVVVNCIGVLQDSRRGSAKDVHEGFVARLVEAISGTEHPCLLVHISVPGRDKDDRTAFSASKHAAERVIMQGTLPFVILRPGFVVAPAAYGGSALVRALAALPFRLPDREASRPFASIGVGDIARTVAIVTRGWNDGKQQWNVVWDLMERKQRSFGEVVTVFRRRLGASEPGPRLPTWLMGVGARLGDLAALLGWSPPVRSTALAEMRRGVEGDPDPWIAATGIEPASLEDTLSRMPATVQEKWFGRLYFLKPLVFGSLSLFWIASGLIALTVSFEAATAILISHGFAPSGAGLITVVSSLADIAVGAAIATRWTCRRGLIAGICLSLFYMAGAAILTPEMWVEPLGALVKTFPAIVLMLVALGILDER